MVTIRRIAALTLWAALAAAGQASVLRVDSRSTAASPDGLTWTSAFPTVQAALNKSIAGDEVWVAAGTYTESVAIPVGVSLLGGFADTEATGSARDPVGNKTILMGPGISSAPSASATVVMLPMAATPETMVDGFTITNGGGKAVQIASQSGACSGRDGGGWRKVYLEFRGGAVMVPGGSPTITNNVITGNSTAHSAMTGSVSCHSVAYYYQAGDGGGIYVAAGASPYIAGNIISNNAGQHGGGVYCVGSSPVLTDNIVSGNTAVFTGGGVDIAPPASSDAAAGPMLLSGNIFRGNSAGTDGGGVCGTAEIRSGVFDANVAGGNGGGFAGGGSVTDCVFTGNSANAGGGGISATAACTVVRCTFRLDSALSGGAVASANSLGFLRDCVLTDNVAGQNGAALSIGGSSVIENNTIALNTSPLGCVTLSGGGGFSQRILLENNIVADNQSGIDIHGARVAVRFNDVYANGGGDYLGIPGETGRDGNISIDPGFVDPSIGDFRLGPASPCVDVGDSGLVPGSSTDREGFPRLMGKAVDLGAFERLGATLVATRGPLHVSSTGTDTNDGLTWATAKGTLQNALDTAWSLGGAEIWVSSGTYDGPLTARAPVQVYGGFAGTEVTRDARNWATNATAVDGHLLGSSIYVDDSEAGRFDAFVLDGFHVVNGLDQAVGGGMTCGPVTLSVVNNVIENNAGAQGGGIYAAASTGEIARNTIRNNQPPSGSSTPSHGGGVFAGASVDVQANVITGNTSDIGGGVYGAGSVIGNTISANTATQSGGGAYSCDLVSRNVIQGNKSAFAGGGIMLASTIEDNLITQNTSGTFGGGADVQSGARVLNNTFIGNSSAAEATDIGTGPGGALSIEYGGGLVVPDVVANNIVAFNSSGITMLNLNTTYSDNDMYGNTDADWNGLSAPPGTLSVDPLFVNRSGQGYQLQAGSPCIDAGDDSVVTLAALDLAGNARKIGAHVDIGAYEYVEAGAFGIRMHPVRLPSRAG
ncbi:MAG TPA: right-handed parallel beta-helix repeat-containing protein [Armatimonadota bacterium]|jgi:hypothetical protein